MLAIIPPRVVLSSYKEGVDKKLLREQEKIERTNIQESMHFWLERRKREGKISIDA